MMGGSRMMIRWFRPGLSLNTLLSLMVYAAAETAVAAAAPESVPSGGTPTAEAWSDTLHVAAPRVTLDEIMADIGRRQRANRDSLRSVAFTAVVTTARSPDGVAVGAADSAGTWELEESALRYHQDRGQPDRVVQLWERKQKIERGVAQPAKVTPTGKPRWQPRPADMVNDLPFAEGGARLYRYELLASKLVGNSLVHVVGFAPRDRFAALPSGTVWVDIADWAIRRVEARFEGPVPFPWIIRSVPYYRLSQAPCGNVWFPVLESARVDLRDLPLVDAGGTYQIRVELRDIVINGEPCDGGGLNADTDEGAALFWAAIDDMWQAELPAPLQQPLSLAPAQVDSLSRAGASMLAAAPELPPYGLRSIRCCRHTIARRDSCRARAPCSGAARAARCGSRRRSARGSTTGVCSGACRRRCAWASRCRCAPAPRARRVVRRRWARWLAFVVGAAVGIGPEPLLRSHVVERWCALAARGRSAVARRGLDAGA
jgi:hypothetical protein